MSDQNSEPRTQDEAFRRANEDKQTGTQADTQRWSDAARQNYNNERYSNGSSG